MKRVGISKVLRMSKTSHEKVDKEGIPGGKGLSKYVKRVIDMVYLVTAGRNFIKIMGNRSKEW